MNESFSCPKVISSQLWWYLHAYVYNLKKFIAKVFVTERPFWNNYVQMLFFSPFFLWFWKCFLALKMSFLWHMKFFLSICSLAKNASKSQKIEKYHVCFVQSSPPPTHSHHNQRMNKLEQNERTKISNPKSKTCFQTYIFDTFKAGNFYVHRIFCNELTNEF